MRKLALPAVALAALAVFVLPAVATYPGVNGPLTYSKNLEPGEEVGVHEIFSLDGGVETQLSDTFPGAAINSDWSPDAARIAYDAIPGFDSLPDIWVMNANGSGQVRLTSNDWWDAFPSWSPNGEWIAMESDGPSYPETQGIWMMHPDGARLTRVTTIPAGVAFDSEPAFSPDGTRLVFTRFRGSCKFPNRNRFIAAGCTSAIHLVNLDGTGLERITPWGNAAASPDWSPDGKRITYHRCCDAGKQGQKLDVYVMNANGSGDRRLTTNPPWTGGPFIASGNPVWSPDGTKIAFTQWFAERPSQIMVMNADGSSIQGVTNDPDASFNEPDWGPDFFGGTR
jgi:Tol biopolymer transport system component